MANTPTHARGFFRPLTARVVTAATVFTLSCLVASAISAQAARGEVERIIDGDTLVVAGVGAVRLIGVDAPETVDPRKPVQYFGAEASAFTRQIAQGKLVQLEFEGSTKDKYNRTLAYVQLPDGRMLNEELIRQGYAHVDTAYPFSRMEAFRALERDAREQERGLWDTSGASHVAVNVAADQAPAVTVATTVYVTRTGAKYHRAGCRHLARSQLPMELKDAAARYGPCSVCQPPTLAATTSPPAQTPAVPAAFATPKPAAAKPAQTSSRCQATTKKGTQCLRNAQAGRAYCWQH
jgi:micrococcal nuclease